MSAYEPAAYWKELLEESFDESGVAYPHLARALNRAMYHAFERSVKRALSAADVAPAGMRVLDVGCGTGVWIDFWTRLGAQQVRGVDLTDASVQRLSRAWPSCTFAQADVGEANTVLPDENDLVSAMSVLLHIVDEDRFRQAFANLSAALRPGGVLVLVEPAVVHRWWGPPFGEDANSKARPLADYRQAMTAAGLRLIELQPATVLLANVVDTRSRLGFAALQRYWDLLSRAVGKRERLAAMAACVLRPADSLATRLARTGPSAKVLVARREA